MMKAWVLAALGGLLIVSAVMPFVGQTEVNQEPSVKALTPTEVDLGFIDASGRTFWESRSENITPQITPGSTDKLSLLLGAGLLGKTAGDQYVTARLDQPFGHMENLTMPRTVYEGPATQSLSISGSERIANLTLGDTLSVVPSNLTAKVVAANDTHRTIVYTTGSGMMRHPSNLSIQIERSDDRLQFDLPYEEGDRFLLTQDCADYGNLSAGWYQITAANESSLNTTFVPFTEARTFKEAFDIVTRTSRVSVEVLELDYALGQEYRELAESRGLLLKAKLLAQGHHQHLDELT